MNCTTVGEVRLVLQHRSQGLIVAAAEGAQV